MRKFNPSFFKIISSHIKTFLAKIKVFFQKPKVLYGLFAVLSIFAALQSYFLSFSQPVRWHGLQYTLYNNYLIFKQSFFHLIQQDDLYVLFLDEQLDLYKYSPTFALFFGFFACFPDWLGLILWNLLNTLLLVYAVYAVPGIAKEKKPWLLLFCIVELLTSIQNEQSNGLMAALLILVFVFLEKKNWFWAAFCVVASGFIKIFGFAGFVLFLMYPEKGKQASAALFWMAVFLVLPLLVVPVDQLLYLYTSWWKLLGNDVASSYGFSVMGILNTWFGLDGIKSLVLMLGLIGLFLPYLNIKAYKLLDFRLLQLCALLLWVIIFNHKAESPTFIIAMTGITLWYFSSEKKLAFTLLFVFAFLLTSLSSTDVFPGFVRQNFIEPYALKGLPSILIWIVLLGTSLFFIKKNENV